MDDQRDYAEEAANRSDVMREQREEFAAEDASLGVGHIWTATQCPAYRSLDPRECICTRPVYFATKYDSAAAEVVAILSDVAEGYGRDSAGDVEAPTGYFALLILDGSYDLDFSDTSTNYPAGDYAGEVARTYGVTAADVVGAWIVTTNSQGFVSCDKQDDETAAREAFAALERAYDAWNSDDENGEG